jgi:hypothetical protein
MRGDPVMSCVARHLCLRPIVYRGCLHAACMCAPRLQDYLDPESVDDVFGQTATSTTATRPWPLGTHAPHETVFYRAASSKPTLLYQHMSLRTSPGSVRAGLRTTWLSLCV